MRIRSHAIHQSSYRRKLPARPKDAYKAPLGKGRWIGYLKGEAGSESWCACWIDERGIERQQVVGAVSEFSYESALPLVQKAIEQGLKGGGSDTHYTVRQACLDYITHQETHGGTKAGEYARAVLEPFVLEHPIADKKLRELRHRDIERWQGELPTIRTKAQTIGKRAKKAVSRKANSSNRIMRIFIAALNRAKARKVIVSDDAWVDIAPFKGRDGQREVFLDLAQRRALLNAASPDLRRLLLALLHTGARPIESEIADIVVKDFDPRTGTIRFTQSKGKGEPVTRTTFLTPSGVAFFQDCAKDKLPLAPLLTRQGQKWRSFWWHRELKDALAAAKAAGAKLPDGIVAYTMRHTTISEWLANGAAIEKVAKNVGTSIAMIEKHYHKFIRADFLAKIANVQVV